MRFVDSMFVGGEFCSILSDYEKLRIRNKIPEAGGYLLRKSRVYWTHECGAEKKLMNGFVLIRVEGDKEREARVEKVLLLFRNVMEEMKRTMEWHLHNLWSPYLFWKL